VGDELERLLETTEREIEALGPAALTRALARRDRQRLAGEILSARLERGWTQRQLAEAAGIAQPELSDIERAVSNPTESTLARVFRALGRQLTSVPVAETSVVEEERELILA
jgi:ribosome-binding protein aMBF1 (putative translation factor)